MFELKRICGVAAVVLAVGAVGGATSTAQASVAPRVRAMRAARAMFIRSLPPRLRGHVRPAAAAPVTAGTFLTLFTDPVPVAVHGLDYEMSMDAQAVTDAFGSPPQVSVGLNRMTRGVDGRVNGEQEHVYGFSSTDMVMTANQDLTGLHIDTRRSVRPTRVNTTFQPVDVQSGSCRLFTGGSGTLSVAQGALDTKAFRIHTGSWPFFGTITARPQTGFAFSDPGCVGAVKLGRTTTRRRYHAPCEGRESITVGTIFGDTNWDAEVIRGGTRAVLEAQDATSTATTMVGHYAAALQSGRDMPRPERSAHGAVALIRTAGNPMFSGGATFVSHRRPAVSRVRVCAIGRHLHRFVATRYRGTLSPDDGAPLVALFDTGAFPLEQGAASLVLRRYVR